MKRTLVVGMVFLMCSAPLLAGNVCPCTPKGYTWTVTACQTWNCAASALVLANGDPSVIALPTASHKFSWVVLRREAGGAVHIPDDAPFQVEQFDAIAPATARYSSIESSRSPMLITTSDGTTLIIYASQPLPRRRASRP